MAYINTNYLKKQLIKDTHGHIISINENEKEKSSFST